MYSNQNQGNGWNYATFRSGYYPNYSYTPYSFNQQAFANAAGQPGYSNAAYGWNQAPYTTAQPPYTYGYGYQGYTETEQGSSTAGQKAAGIPKGVMNYFHDENGELDFDKMMSTTGQVMKTVQQVSPLVKGIGSFVKGIK